MLAIDSECTLWKENENILNMTIDSIRFDSALLYATADLRGSSAKLMHTYYANAITFNLLTANIRFEYNKYFCDKIQCNVLPTKTTKNM